MWEAKWNEWRKQHTHSKRVNRTFYFSLLNFSPFFMGISSNWISHKLWPLLLAHIWLTKEVVWSNQFQLRLLEMQSVQQVASSRNDRPRTRDPKSVQRVGQCLMATHSPSVYVSVSVSVSGSRSRESTRDPVMQMAGSSSTVEYHEYHSQCSGAHLQKKCHKQKKHPYFSSSLFQSSN